MKNAEPSVAVLGAGIGGLASAYALLQAGYQVTIFEAADRIGGLGAYFEHKGFSFERFYHVILDSDADLRRLAAELGIAELLSFRESRMGFHIDGKLFPLNTAWDLLRFGALAPASRVRVGLAGLYLRSCVKNSRELDSITASEWLRRLFGAPATARIWEPLMRAKFGEAWNKVPAYWMWSRLTREKGSAKEVKGYLQGGYRCLAEALLSAIRNRGGELRLNCAVQGIGQKDGKVWIRHQDGTDAFDAAISTLPLPLLDRLAEGELSGRIPLPDLNYQGVVNVVIISRSALQPYYWTAVVDPRFPFQGVVETTNLIPIDQTGGRHLIYVMNYCAADSDLFRASDDVQRRRALEGLAAIYPSFRRADVEAAYVFRAPFVEPVWTTGYLEKLPRRRVADSRLYLCTTAQAYPHVNAWNTSIALARATVGDLVRDVQSIKNGLGKDLRVRSWS